MKGWWPQQVGVSTRQTVKADESTRGLCKSESLQGGSQRPYVEMAPTVLKIFLYSIALYPQCFNLHIKTRAIRAAKLNVFGFFFHLIKNAQNRKGGIRKEEPPQLHFQPVRWGWLVVLNLKDVVLVLVCTFPHPSCWIFQLIFLSERCVSFLVSPDWDRFGVTSADTLRFD